MKILIISDTHLSLPFDEKKYSFLSQLIKKADKVILNGDFWEGEVISFEDFISSPWSGLFPLLKERNAVYVFGNHDKQEAVTDPKKLDLFSDIQAQSYSLQHKGITYLFEHGNRVLPLEGKRILPRKYMDLVERLFILIGGSLYQKLLTQKYSKVIKAKLKKERSDNKMFVTGHIHHQEIDQKARYANSGVVKHGLAQWLWLDDEGLHAHAKRYSLLG